MARRTPSDPALPRTTVAAAPIADALQPAETGRLPVRVVRSRKRRRTVSARIVDGVAVVQVPASMTHADEVRYVDELRRRLERKVFTTHVDLPTRARTLADRYGLPRPTDIRWVSNQAQRWGSCSPASGHIRISDRLDRVPPWVLDYVVVHELAHLRHGDHGPRFWALVERYPQGERAKGFLEGFSHALGFAADETNDTHNDDVDSDEIDIADSGDIDYGGPEPEVVTAPKRAASDRTDRLGNGSVLVTGPRNNEVPGPDAIAGRLF